ncbi:MAG: hypothetical protein ACRDZ8_19495, partial [Acidimicrobiales bacterium]
TAVTSLLHIPLPVLPLPQPASPQVTALPTPPLGGAVGCDFRQTLNQLLFVEFSGKLSRLNLFPATSVVASGTTILKGTWTFDLDTGTEGGVSAQADIWWEQETAFARRMTPQNGAGIFNLGIVDFDTLSPAALQNLPYASAPIPANNDASNKLVTGDVFAVRTNAGNLAKVKVVSYGYDITIQWATYHVEPMYEVLGTGYLEPEDVKASADGTHAYVTERAGNLLRVELANANRAAATVVSSGMTAPQQLFLDEAAGFAYTVEYAPSGRLWRISLANGAKTAVLSGLINAVGVTLSTDRQYAFISEQTTGADGGRVSRYQLPGGQRLSLAVHLVAPFFLTWADPAETVLYCPQRDPSNTLAAVPTDGSGFHVIVTGLDARPSSVAVIGPGNLLVCCNAAIEEVWLAPPLAPSGPLVQGVGHITTNFIGADGYADTTSDPAYYFPVHHAPFGGSLPLMVNFLAASLAGYSYYQVKVDSDSGPRTDVFHTTKWDGTQFVPATFGPATLPAGPGFYPVLGVADLLVWQPGLPGCYLDSTTVPNGVRHVTVSFFDSTGTLETAVAVPPLFVDNNPCAVTLAEAVIGATPANACGFLPYNPATKATDVLTVAYTATQPNGNLTWGFQLVKAAAAVASASGTGDGPPASFSETVAVALGSCVIAAFAAGVEAYATATTGWGRCSQYDRSRVEAFALAPPSA